MPRILIVCVILAASIGMAYARGGRGSASGFGIMVAVGLLFLIGYFLTKRK